MMQKLIRRWLALLLAAAAMFNLLILPASAESPTAQASLENASTASLVYDRSENLHILNKSTGGTFGGCAWVYTTDTGVTGPGYCVNYNLTGAPNKVMPVEKFSGSPKTMGAFANGYPQRTLEQFKELHKDDVRGIDALTELEYAYATQVAVWSTCGQVSVPGTSFTAGSAAVVVPTSDAQQIRVYDSVKAILSNCGHWTKQIYTGMYIRGDKEEDMRVVEVTNKDGLLGAARDGEDGIKQETINGTEYYTRVMYVASATSTYIDGYKTKVYSTDAPAGTIFVAENNSALETVEENGATCYKVDTSEIHDTICNANGQEFVGAFKVCIPVDSAAAEGSFTLHASGGAAQFGLYLAKNGNSLQQSYIMAEPAYTTTTGSGEFKWSSGTTIPGESKASLQVNKVGPGGSPLKGAEFTLIGSGGTSVSGKTDGEGRIVWKDLPANESYTLEETKAPDGYQIVDPINITLTASQTKYVTVRDETDRVFTIKKIDAQNGASLKGAVFLFEQIDGTYKTTGTTGFDGTIQFVGDELPYGSYRVTEQTPPEGYQKDTSVETVEWDGTRDVTLTFEDVRDTTILLVKIDADTGVSLPGASFDVYADGSKITSVTTNHAGEARITGIRQEAYIEVVETAAPDGYVKDETPHGIHVDPYDPAIEDDPVLTITNRARPGLRIMKYDQTTKQPLPNVTFKIYKDGEPFDTRTTGDDGLIELTGLEPGTYLVEEYATDDEHVVTSTPQQIELKAGQQETQTLVFFNSLKPGIHLVKVDNVTMKSIPNVRFEFKKVGGSYKEEFVTDEKGEIDLSKLEPGAYEVTELEAPDGYLIDNAVRVIQLNPDENANFVFTNTPKPSIRLIKTSSDGTRLAGVHFRIAKIEDGSRYLDRITEDNGEINISGLEPGVYSVKETATVSDHILDVREYHVELFPGQTSTITIENQKRPGLTIQKTDKDTGDPIPGVTFTLKFSDGHTITTEPTGPDGKVFIENLLPGVYTVIEQNVPEGYILDQTPQQVTLLPNRNASVQFQNYKRPTLKIAKVDINGKFLTGAIFEVKTKAGVKIGDFPVGADGTVTISNVHLTEGYYIVTEKQAPKGYILDPTPHEVYLRPGKTTEISIENEKKPGLTIIKIDSVTGEGVKGAKFELWVSKDKTENGTYQKLNDTYYYTDENGLIELPELDTGWYKVKEVEPPAGYTLKEPSEQILYIEHDKGSTLTFENTPKNAIAVEKYDSVTGEALPGCTFQLRFLGGASGTGGTVLGQKVTGKNGIAMWTGLKPGAYIVEEVDAADGYSILQASETVFLADDGEQSVVTVRFTNAPDGILLIRKVCSVNPSVTLQDAEFKVTYADGTLIGDSNGIFRSDENGEVRITGLKPGKSVIVTETKAPAGFIIDTQSQTAQIKEGRTVSLTFKNQPRGSLIIQKRDSATGKPLSGAEFRVTTAAGCEVGLDGVIGTSTLTQNGIFTTNAEGEIRISNLAPGAYVLNEIKAPDGYVMDAPSTNVVIGTNGDTQTVIVKNSKAGSLLIEKRDSVTNEPLEGVTFKITTSTGEFVPDESGAISSNGLYHTDANGQILLNGVVGTLVVTEEKTLPGYVIDEANRSQTVVVKPNDTQKLTFYNIPKNTLTIQKYAVDRKSPLPGVKFSVKESDGSVVGPNNGLYITDNSGQAVVENLTPGKTVIVREVETVDGYTLETVPQTVLVKEGEPLSVIFGNKPLANLTILKRDAKGKPLSGAQFLVTDQKGLPIGPYDGHYTTGSNGQVTVTGIQPDTAITVREEKAPAGYVLNPEPQTITVRSNEDNTLTFVNGEKGTLVVVKVDAETGTPLAGAEFKVTTAGGTLVADKEGAVSSNGMYSSGRDGSFTITGLEPGSYIITETKAPDGYVLNPVPVTVEVTENDTQTIKIKNTPLNSLIIQKYEGDTTTPVSGAVFLVSDDNGAPIGVTEGKFTTDANGRIVIDGLTPGMSVTAREIKAPDAYVLDGTPKSVKIKEGASQTLTFRNEKKGALIIEKKDKVSGAPLAGAEFRLTYNDGSYLETDGHTGGVYETDRNGEIRLTGITGTITAKETNPPEGYVTDQSTQSQTVTVKARETKTLTFLNEPLCSLTLTKRDSVTGKPVPNTEFVVKDGSGNVIDHYTTGKDGTAVVTGLVPGATYVVAETKVPSGYVLDSTPQTITVKNGSNTVTSGSASSSNGGNQLDFENDPKMTLTIHKYIEGTDNEPLSGVEFKVTDGSGKEIGPSNGIYYTDHSGDIVLEGLEPGTTIIARETKTADGFVLDGTPQKIKIEAGKAQSMTFWNKRAGELVIRKLDKLTKEPLSGAEFELTYAGGGYVDNVNGHISSNGLYTTDAKGEIRVSGVTGAIVVKETRPADGYVIDLSTQTQTVTVDPQETQTLTFFNEPLCSLTLTKLDSVTGKPVRGAEFTIKDGEGNLFGRCTTGTDGTATMSGLTPGAAYVVTETKAPVGYVLNSAPQTITVKSGAGNALTFENDPMTTLTIQKYIDGTNNEPLAGVEFFVTDSSGAVIGSNNGYYTTDKDGRIVIEGLEPGTTIIAKETRTVEGYVRNAEPQSIKIKSGEAQTMTFWNKKGGTLVIQKKDKLSHAPLTGVEFELTYADGSYVDDENGHISSKGRYTTDDKGEIRISGIVGTIIVKEIKAIDGYVIDPAMQTQTITVNPDDTQTVQFYNEPLCSLTLTKRDSVTGKPVPNTEFAVKDGNGNIVGRYTTGQDGTVVVTGLIPGAAYVVAETKVPSGYVLNSTPQTITVKNGSNTVTSGSVGGSASSANGGNQLDFENDPKTTLVIQKFIAGTNNEPLSGVEFLVTDSSGAVIGTSNGRYTTDKDGRIVIEGLEPGQTITARETRTVEGYVLDAEPQSIKIKTGEAQSMTFWNKKAGTLVIRKLDKLTNAPLTGAEFELTYAGGGYVDDANGHLSSKGMYTTDAKGEIRISGITGTIVAKETRPANGYVIDQSTQTQTVTVNPQDTQTLTFLNEPLCSLTLTKLDSVTGKPVPNTEFTVKDGNGNVFGRYTTGKDGTVVVTGLIPGATYVVTETEVPSGYVLNSTPQTITVRNGNNTVTSGSGGTPSGGSNGGAGSGLTFENDPKMTLTIHKYIDGTQNEPLAGVAFKLTDGSGAPIGPGDGEYYTNAAGEIVVEGLEPGTTVTAREIKTVDGFVLDGTSKTVKIAAGSQAPELTFWNKRAGELVIRKLDKLTSEPLAGVEFELTYAQGGYVDNENGHLSSKGLYTTDAKGEIRISGITGTIVVKETKTLPGYTIDPGTQSQTVTVNPADTQTLTFYNTPGTTLTIQKFVDGTTTPIQGVTFLVTDSSGAVLGPNNGEYVTDQNGRIVINDLTPGVTITARETGTADGYVLDSTPQSILIKEGEGQTITFYNKADGGLELIKVSASDKTKRIPGTTFEIRRKDGGLVDTVTTGENGRVHVELDAGDYYAVEIEAAEGFKLDDTPQHFTIEDGRTTTLTVTNKAFSGILIHKTDSVTGKGIYGVTFLLYDSTNKPIGQYTSDDTGYVYIDDLTASGRYYLREMENEGYVPDTEMKTVYVTAGETTLVEWQNIPITAQIQIVKKSADYNSTNGLPAGTLLEGAVFEIYDKANNLVDTIKSDQRGLAASKPLPLGRYTVREVKAPANYGVSDTVLNAYLEHEGQIVCFEVTDKSLSTGVGITKTGPREAMAGQPVRYQFSGISNSSTVRLDSFYWRDTLPAEVRLEQIVTGTYNFPGTYKITYRVNGGEPRTLADSLSTQKNYTLAASPVALGLASNERVTEVMFVFGQAPAGFAQVEAPNIYCTAVSNLRAASFVNVADVGGAYNGVWVQGVSRWVTTVYAKPTPLPKTGY